MLDVTYGVTPKQTFARQVADALKGMDLEGSLYIGYPVFATADEQITVDGLLVSKEHGLVILALREDAPHGDDQEGWRKVRDDLDRLYVAVEANLRKSEELRVGRQLAVVPETVAIFPVLDGGPQADGAYFSDVRALPNVIDKFGPLADEYYRPLQAALQRVSTIKPRKRRAKATTPQSRGSVLKEIEKEIANLDKLQKQAAIESPDGPQRIRGLAGSGKTIVLALKAAYLHAQHPDWTIAVTFQTRSLYQQFEDLIRRFSFEQINDEPDWQNLRILHAWGGSGREGLYSQIARSTGLEAHDFLYGRARFGRERAFEGVCAELLSQTTNRDIEPLYDAVLIDEAQDFPPSFFKLAYRFTSAPKRVVWAYDELQRLSETVMPDLGELFGYDEHGEPIVSLTNDEGAQQDIILKVCYRNPPWTLAVAHAVGLGIYRKSGLIQHFDDPGLWKDIGYRIRQGELEAGSNVTLERSPDSYPGFFTTLLQPEDVVTHKHFNDVTEQAGWIAASIKQDVTTGELEMDDILVVLPNALTAKSDARPIAAALASAGLSSHLVGVTSSVDEIFNPESIAMAHIHRSKGNEAAMVYVANAQQCLAGAELITLRNTLFTAITRSRAWVRLCGVGSEMAALEQEVKKVVDHHYGLRFKVPTAEELAKIRQIHRELSASERQKIQAVEKSLRTLRDLVDRGDFDLDQLPMDLRTFLAQQFMRDRDLDDDEF